MLQAIRDRAMGVLGWVVIGLIIITFALFGLGSYLQDQSRVFAATVNDVEIPMRELQIAYQNQRARMEQLLGDAFNPALIDERTLKRQALESLIQRELILQAAHSARMGISDQLLAARIQAIPAFQEDGRFQEARYQDILARQGQVPAGFEYETRRTLTAEQLVSGLSNTAFVTRPEIARAYRLQDQKRTFDYIQVAAAPMEANIELGEEDIKAYYEENSNQFVTPERVRLAYLRLNIASLGAMVEVDEAELLAVYEKKKQNLKTQEKRRASHILFQVPEDADEAAVDAVNAEVEQVLAQIRNGGDFAELARQHSDDPGSSAQGGDLGYFATGAMVPEFDAAVFAMEVDTVSEPVRSQFGFHIIKLTDIKGSEIASLEDVRVELTEEIKQREIDDLYYEQMERLTDVVYENPDNLEAAADELQLEIQTSEWISAQSGNGIGQYPKVIGAAFSEDVLEAGNNSEPLEVGPNDAIVIRVIEREAAHTTPLDQVKEQVVSAMKKQRAAEAVKARGEQLLAELGQGADMKALAETNGLELRQADAVGRGAPGHTPELVREVFRMPRPAEGAVRDNAIALANGDYAIVRLALVTDADADSMTEAQQAQLRRGFENMRRNEVLAVMVNALRGRAELVIPEDSE